MAHDHAEHEPAGHHHDHAGQEHHDAAPASHAAPVASSHAHHAHGAHHHGHHHHGEIGKGNGRAFAIGIGLNLSFVVGEVVAGFFAHSVALLADAGHNFGDVLGLGLAWGAAALAQRKPSIRRTYGLRRTTIVASMTNAVTLLFITGGLAWESVRRLFSPTIVSSKIVIVVAFVGTVLNILAALPFMRGREHDLNIRGAFTHLAADAALSLGVAVAGGIVLLTGWTWVDPAMSIVLAVSILLGTWSLMRGSLDLMLDAVPEGIDPEAVRGFLCRLPGVVQIHDLHIWAMSTTETALTAHLVMPANANAPAFLSNACKAIHEQFGIDHSTLQIDHEDAPHPCRLAADEVV
jgi:cobalt-zinc-cadmium efflux system protein